MLLARIALAFALLLTGCGVRSYTAEQISDARLLGKACIQGNGGFPDCVAFCGREFWSDSIEESDACKVGVRDATAEKAADDSI